MDDVSSIGVTGATTDTDIRYKSCLEMRYLHALVFLLYNHSPGSKNLGSSATGGWLA
ncbi:hypothetical protein N434_02872 [Rhizobium sp. UGM030330-04]|nr:hypothetical protein N434_02872 [Rhizobium sp. UGM030330-04]